MILLNCNSFFLNYIEKYIDNIWMIHFLLDTKEQQEQKRSVTL